MPSKFSSGKYAIAHCDRCGFRTKLKELRPITVKTKRVNLRVCRECWEADHPQLQLGLYPVNDPQAVRDPRPDTSYPQSRAWVEQIYIGVGVGVQIGTPDVALSPSAYTLPAATGTLSLIGRAATLTSTHIRNFALSAATGSFAISGQPATLTFGSPTSGSLMITQGGDFLLTQGSDTLITN